MKTIAFNWKLNPQTEKQAEVLFEIYSDLAANSKNQVIVCPPFEYLFGLCRRQNHGNRYLGLGAQDCFWENLGPFTGEVSALNMKLAGIDYVILGHSERRIHLKETDEMVNRKLLNAITSELRPILCFGEDAAVHEKGEASVKKFIKKQVAAAIKGFESLPLSQKNNLIFAYEPVWAISGNSGNVADSPSDAGAVIRLMKDWLVSDFKLQSPRVLYGGSVNGKNVQAFLSQENIDGFLVGKASLVKDEVKKIIEETDRMN